MVYQKALVGIITALATAEIVDRETTESLLRNTHLEDSLINELLDRFFP